MCTIGSAQRWNMGMSPLCYCKEEDGYVDGENRVTIIMNVWFEYN